MKQLFSRTVLSVFFSSFCLPQIIAQNVGIGTNTPAARLHVTDSSVVFSVSGETLVNPGDPPLQGQGRRMLWYADKAAFRAGYVSSDRWNRSNTGDYSFAAGFDTRASGKASVAMGNSSTASGFNSFAVGYNTLATGESSSATGSLAYAIGERSTAMGSSTTATGTASTAMGYLTTASGIASTAMGFVTTASGNYSTALGNYVSTSGYDGAFAIGDNSATTVMPSFVDNGFRSRFAGGYRLLTNSAATIGVVLVPNSNAWSAISDVRVKEKFLPVDGENILIKLSRIPSATWNYKDQDCTTERHYGPMAQDFYAAFGKDNLGTIGCDTLINQQDFLGVNLIAIQALEKRSVKLKEENIVLKNEIDELKARIIKLEKLLTRKL